ncbi:hypothetical protein [Neisseria bacilliformis]|uniref:Uncharacterized protein n=1 Tax=Myoviridae sp. ctpjm1 TaxID=2826699 RepID=A0A8S5NMW0_9CAUD|nr:hypothetical protein [Neisseria bacilliformis]DAD96062.1 MAG TPA: hypothetical protein [Myoviridae sp. ctpjm1]DAS09546.1 MAG TPA: hypothetical protein [Bacteriophage sp.]
MIHLKQLKEAQELYDEVERSAEIAVRILENAQKQKAAAAAHEQKALRCLTVNAALTALIFGLWLGINLGG